MKRYLLLTALLLAVARPDVTALPSQVGTQPLARAAPAAAVAGAIPPSVSRAPGAVFVDPVIAAIVDSVSSSAIDASVLRLQNFVTRHTFTDSSYAAADWIEKRFRACGLDSVYRFPYDPRFVGSVVAVKPGVGHPDKMIVVGGHFDSVSHSSGFVDCPGADDNASGTAGVLECARVLAPHDFDYTLVFIAFAGEEQGHLGSEAWAAAAQASGYDILGMLNMDMIGYVAPTDTADIDVISNASSQWLDDIVLGVASTYVPELPAVGGAIPTWAHSDHESFWDHGYDAVMFFEDTDQYSPYMHTVKDVVGTSYNAPYLAAGTVRIVAATLATLAEPFRVIIQHTPLADTPDTDYGYRVDATLLAAGTLDPDSLAVRYRVSGGPFEASQATAGGSFDGGARRVPIGASGEMTIPLLPTGASGGYEAMIPPQPGGTVVDYYLVAGDTDGFRATDPKTAPAAWHRFIVGTASSVASDDFETDTGWTAGAAGDDATGGLWVRDDPHVINYYGTIVQPEDDHTPDPGVACWVTGNPWGDPPPTQFAGDVDGGTTTLTSPVYDLSGLGNAWVHYYRWFSDDTGGDPTGDLWAVDVSSDSGATWVRMETLTESDRAWRGVARYLLDYVPLTSGVRFRVVARDGGDPSVVEGLFDDFEIVAYGGSSTSSAGTKPHVVQLSQNVPNPFNPATTIRIAVPPPGAPATLRVYDVAGHLVATLLDGEVVSGERAIPWDGRDWRGLEAASGVYFYRLNAGGVTLTRKMVLIR